MAFDAHILAQEEYCYLTTLGRVTGKKRRIEIWFADKDATVYMLAGYRERAHWVQNAGAQPQVTIEIGGCLLTAVARIALNEAEAALARRLVFEKYSSRESGLEDWAQTALPVAFDLDTA